MSNPHADLAKIDLHYQQSRKRGGKEEPEVESKTITRMDNEEKGSLDNDCSCNSCYWS